MIEAKGTTTGMIFLTMVAEGMTTGAIFLDDDGRRYNNNGSGETGHE